MRNDKERTEKCRQLFEELFKSNCNRWHCTGLYYGLKKSTRDIDFAFPTQSECFWFAEALRESRYVLRKGEAVWWFIDFERELYIDISYGKIGDVSLSQAMFSRFKKEKIDKMSVWIPALEDLFIMNVCHSIDIYETMKPMLLVMQKGFMMKLRWKWWTKS